MKSSCTGCSRRAVLQGLGLAALAACGNPTEPSGKAAACGSNLCLDLTDPTNGPFDFSSPQMLQVPPLPTQPTNGTCNYQLESYPQ